VVMVKAAAVPVDKAARTAKSHRASAAAKADLPVDRAAVSPVRAAARVAAKARRADRQVAVDNRVVVPADLPPVAAVAAAEIRCNS
jgi:hypothetical protein